MITFDMLGRHNRLRPELNRVKRLGHKIAWLDVQGRDFCTERAGRRLYFSPTRIVAQGCCDGCGGSLIIERDTRSREADALTVAGDVLAMECV